MSLPMTGAARCLSCGDGTGPVPAAEADRWAERHTAGKGGPHHPTAIAAVPAGPGGQPLYPLPLPEGNK